MKKVVLAACVICFALAVPAHTRDEQKQHLGGRNDNGVTATVPQSAPTIALTLVSLVAVGVFIAFFRSRKPGP